MIWVALTLGFFGSLHCLGMCGPLALGVTRFANVRSNVLFYAIQYNVGRIFTYAILGAVFGLIGQAILLSGFQKGFSILAGIILVGLFALSLNIEKVLFRIPSYQNVYNRVFKKISETLKNGSGKYPFLIGLLNGILPCGLVYLALAGSLASGNLFVGIAFMIFFGIGTLPAMIGVMWMGGGNKFRILTKGFVFNKVFPILHLAFGIYLIYRGVVIDMPEQLDFWTAINHPVMCH
jgi:sulfite exporter TauE/SafE